MAAPKTVTVVVANGRSLCVPGQPMEYKDGEQVKFSHRPGKVYGPGEQVQVSATEAEALRGLGFVQTTAAAPAPVSGLVSLPDGGPSVQQQP